MNSLPASFDMLSLVTHIVKGQSAEDQKSAYDKALETIDPKVLHALCMTIDPKLFINLMKTFIGEHFQTYMDETVEKKFESDGTASISSATSTSSASSIVDMFTVDNKPDAGMSWADITEQEEEEAHKAAAALEAAATPVHTTGYWEHRNSEFPALSTPGTKAVAKAAPKAFAKAAPKAFAKAAPKAVAKPPTSAPATNYKPAKAKTVTSEPWYMGLDTLDENQDWFLRETDENGMPIGWRRNNAGWLTSRKNALFRHKLNNQGTEWIHQTYDESTGKWVSKPYEVYKLTMQQASKQR